MENSGTTTQRRTSSPKQETSGLQSLQTGMEKANYWINLIGTWLFRLRKIVLAAPVVYYALRLAAYNAKNLPPQVGIGLQASGEFMQTVGRQLAVMGPLGLTAGCLALMFLSRKVMYPWAVSVFSLALPLLLLLSNVYPY